MRKALIIGVIAVAILALILSGFGAVYLYIQVTRPHNVLAKNAKLYNELKDIQSLNIETKDNGKVQVVTGIDFIDNSPDENKVEKTVKNYTFGDKVKVVNSSFFPKTPDAPTSSQQEIILDEVKTSELVFFIFSDKAKWDSAIKNNNYKLENVKVDNKEMWKMVIDNNEITDLITSSIKDQFTNTLNSDGGYDLSKAKLDFKGKARVTILIDKENNNLYSLDMFLSEDLTIDFGVTFAEILNVAPSEGESKNLKVVLQKDYEQTNKISEVKFKDSNFKITPEKILGVL